MPLCLVYMLLGFETRTWCMLVNNLAIPSSSVHSAYFCGARPRAGHWGSAGNMWAALRSFWSKVWGWSLDGKIQIDTRGLDTQVHYGFSPQGASPQPQPWKFFPDSQSLLTSSVVLYEIFSAALPLQNPFSLSAPHFD